MECKVLDLGLLEYISAYHFQKRLVDFRIRNEIEDILILTQHPPVITIGKRGSRKNILTSEANLVKKGIRIFEVDRGGDVTLHCPGQLVVYPILDLNHQGKDLYKYLRNLEIIIIQVLNEYGIQGRRVNEHTGVWVDDANIASIGIGCRRWVTFHGFSLNVNPDLTFFSLIKPCGIEDGRITSIGEICGRDVISFERIKEQLIYHFGEVFHLQMEKTDVTTAATEFTEKREELELKLQRISPL